jgi:hypothetical protein
MSATFPTNRTRSKPVFVSKMDGRCGKVRDALSYSLPGIRPNTILFNIQTGEQSRLEQAVMTAREGAGSLVCVRTGRDREL